MKIETTIDYVNTEAKKTWINVEIQFKPKEFCDALRKFADEFPKYKINDWNISEDSMWMEYSRPATQEELEAEKVQEMKESSAKLDLVKMQADHLGYKLVKK